MNDDHNERKRRARKRKNSSKSKHANNSKKPREKGKNPSQNEVSDKALYLTEKEVAILTGFSKKYFQKLRRNGTDGPDYVKKGRCIRYNRAALILWMNKDLVKK
jgi:predicted DNA-binding transcriptional regulator AlpA